MKNLLPFLFGFMIMALPAHAMQTDAKQAIIVDYDTGMILFEKDARERMPTSSMSKVMTAYMVFDAVKKGQVSLDDTFLVSEKAWRKGGSKMFVEVDKRVSVEDLVRGVIIQSGNDATIVLAEGLSGSEQAFANAITAKAHEIGMKDTNFTNASGWPDPDHYSTAYDLSILGRKLIENFPEHYGYYSEKEFTFNNITQRNRNPLLYRDIGADGIKTGHTQVGGYGLIGSGTRNGRRVVMVVNGLDSSKARAQESARLLDWALTGFNNISLFKAGDIVEEANVAMGQSQTVPLVLDQNLVITTPTLQAKSIEVAVEYNGPLRAPIIKGQEVAELVVSIPKMETIRLPLIAGENVDELGFLARTIANAQMMLAGKKDDAVEAAHDAAMGVMQ